MKKLVVLAVFALSFTNSTLLQAQNFNVSPVEYTLDSSSLENAVIYEVNIRQYSTEGSFNAFTKDIPKLKQLGVKVIWMMPIFPISQTKRKATGGDNSKFASETA